MVGSGGNVSLDPLFCDPMADPFNVDLSASSVMADDPDCVRYGARLQDLDWADPVYGLTADGRGMFPTIQDAMDAVVEGGVISLEDGVYRGVGNVELDRTARAGAGVPSRILADLRHRLRSRRDRQLHPGGADRRPHDLPLDLPRSRVPQRTRQPRPGAVSIAQATWVNFSHCSFESNESANAGGAIMIHRHPHGPPPGHHLHVPLHEQHRSARRRRRRIPMGG